jgi:hypothetical protein
VFLASRQDPALDGLISEFVNELAFHLTNLAVLVDPVRIAVGGGMVRSWDRIGPRLNEALQAGVPFPPELVVAHFPEDAPLLGAVALAVDAAATAGAGGADSSGPGASGPGASGTGASGAGRSCAWLDGTGRAGGGAPGDQTFQEVDTHGSEEAQEQDARSWTHAGAGSAPAVSTTGKSLPLA